MRTVRSIKILDKKWPIKFTNKMGVDNAAECIWRGTNSNLNTDFGRDPDKIKIRPYMSREKTIEKVLHEMLHAGSDDRLSENFIAEIAVDMARAVIRLEQSGQIPS